VTAASWSTRDSKWTVDVLRKDTEEAVTVSCGFLYMCTGYYDYEEGYTPDFVGVDRFEGRIVHPQKWSGDVAYEGKRVVVIGSGATAVTLVPELAKKAAHVTMLQRSPSYVISLPAEDPIANALRRRLPAKTAYAITRWKNVLMALGIYGASRRAPRRMKQLLLGGVKKALGPGYDVDTHFNPRYDPWDERLCVVPDGDLFEALKAGRASVVTDHIETFTERGILLESGDELEADLIVTATGLKLLFLAGLEVTVDGKRLEPKNTITYKAMMFSDVPNLALSFGYTNASWTLKSDLTAEYVCRLLNHMKKHGYRVCVPRQRDPDVRPIPFVDLASGYVKRAALELPKQGDKPPWRLYQNYAKDIVLIRHGKVDDGVMEFARD
jgi:cation diffusion facilitator CzcD-associated flavoprotein CzcO